MQYKAIFIKIIFIVIMYKIYKVFLQLLIKNIEDFINQFNVFIVNSKTIDNHIFNIS